MSLTNRVGLLAGAATLVLSGVGYGETANANSEALSEIASLKAELAEIKARQGDNWLTEQRATEIRALVQDVLADADSRASLQGAGMTAGWDKGFFLASPDGNFKLRIGGQVQFRYVLNNRDTNQADQDSWSHGFENRRTKLTFTGNIIDKTWVYKVQGNFARDGGTENNFGLEDAWIQKDFENGLYTRFGQFKPPFLREELVSSSRQLAVERSLVNEVFNQDYSQGIELGYEGDWLRMAGFFGDGVRKFYQAGAITTSNATSYRNTPWQESTTEYAFAARAEFKIAGEWKQFDDFTSWNGESFGVLIGVAGYIQKDEFGTLAPGERLNGAVTADAQVEFGGANLFGAFVYGSNDIADDFDTGDIKPWGLVVQGGIMVIPDTLEPYARFEWGDPDAVGDDLSVLTIGLNWYISKHAAKFTTDVGYSFDNVINWDASSAGWLTSDEDGEFVWRAQFQLLF